MAVDTRFYEAVTAHLAKLRDEDKRDNSLIRLSGAGFCSRQLGYIVLGVDKEPEEVGTLATFQIGHAFHAMVQEWLVAMGLTTKSLVEYTMVDPKRRIRGTCDAVSVPLDKDGAPLATGKGGRRIFEIKSISDKPREFNGKMLEGAFSKLDKPKDYHSDQATCYAYLWNEEHPGDLVTAITYIYVCKDGAELVTPFKFFTVPLSERRWERLQAKFAKIWESVDEGELPNRDHDPYSVFSPCRFCPYLDVCIATDVPPEDDVNPPDPDEDEDE